MLFPRFPTVFKSFQPRFIFPYLYTFQVARLESIRKTHEAYGETWEHQYRKAAVELESLRDENAMLKTKIRRQYRQIELLTRKIFIINFYYLFIHLSLKLYFGV